MNKDILMGYKPLFMNKKNCYDTRRIEWYPNEYREIVNATSFLDNAKLSERFYCIQNDIFKIPICTVCNVGILKWNGSKYNIGCNLSCSFKHPDTEEKRKQACLLKFGVEHQSKCKDVVEKIKFANIKTNNDPIKRNEIIEKRKQTNLKKYGTDWNSQTQEVKDKMAKTNLERYGCVCPMNNKDIAKRITENNIEKYGVDIASKLDCVKEKQKETNLKKYGTITPLQNKEINKKTKNTLLKKYGVEHIAQLGLHNGYARKEYQFKNGNIIKLQGYEKYAYQYLESLNFKYDDFIHDPTRIQYEFQNKLMSYFPDIVFKNERKLIEVKSTYTWTCDLDKNISKLNASLLNGWNVNLWIIRVYKENFTINKYNIVKDFDYTAINV